jgi:predicted DNA-binding transcriptional regulator AlpA
MKSASQFGQPLQPVLVRSQASEAAGTKLLTLDEVASQLSVSKAWVRDHATRRNPRIPVVRFGGRRAVLRFRSQDIRQFIDTHLVQEESV